MPDGEHHVALCSGGGDSVAATHATMVFGPAEEVVYLDTGTGPGDGAVAANGEWIQDWCASNGWPFRRVETPDDYAEWVAENGYPGPAIHRIAYIKLKDHAIDAVRKDVDGDLHCWTGIRRAESDQRMSVAKQDERGDGRWYWHKPLVTWSDERVREYRERFGLTVSPVSEAIGRSADCWCGCFGDRAELIDLETAGYDNHADWLRSLDAPDGCPREESHWGGHNWDREDFAAADGAQETLCSACWQKARGESDE
jgi:3'-phosphoadenosine 5'-phosphosulfate sulfotransferase (PAPS reductase)/FAD synthetase